MAKNMTRKGLALGAAAAMVVSGFAALPASANGLFVSGYVTLTPNTGSSYTVLTGADKEFALSSNGATAAIGTGKYFKFLVEDASGTITAVQGSGKSTEYAETTANSSGVVAKIATPDRVQVTIANHKFKTGDRAIFTKTAGTDGGFPADGTVVVLTKVDANTVTFDAADSTAINADVRAKLTLTSNAVASGKFVYQTRDDGNGTDKKLVLKTASAETAARTVTVTAWIDNNNDDVIDGTEYVSDVRTVSWVREADLAVTTTLVSPTLGEQSLSAKVTTVPVLNGEQSAAPTVVFTRQDSSAEIVSSAASWSETNKEWTATQSLTTGNWVGMPNIFQIQSIASNVYTVLPNANLAANDVVTSVGTTNPDGALTNAAVTAAAAADKFTTATTVTNQGAAAGYVRVVSKRVTGVTATATVATFTTGGSHNLRVGDLVTTSGGTGNTTANLTRAVVASVPSASTFTVNGTFTPTATTAVGGTVTATYVSFLEVVNGTYSATARWTTKLGNTSSNSVATASAADGTTAVTQNANNKVTLSVNDALASDGNATVVVRPKTLAVSATMKFVTSTGAAVPAGRNVKVTVTTVTSLTGLQINGVTRAQGAVIDAVTDANGSVTLSATATAAEAGASLVVTGVAEGVAATSTSATFNWTAVSYTLHDLNSGTFDGSTDNRRSIAAGGSYTFNLAILDQWAAAPAATSDQRIRVQASGNTVSESFVTLANGRASVTITDAKLSTGDVTVTLTPQKQNASGDWVTGDSAARTYVLNPVAQTGGAVSASASAAAASATSTLTAGDVRTTLDPVVAASGGVTITGTVTNALNGAIRPGAAVTVTGPANVFFTDGSNRSAFGSLTVFANNSGVYTVYAHSNIAQKDSVVTVSSLGGTREVKVTFSPALATSATKWVINAPATVQAGRAVTVTLTLQDKFGNPVTVAANDGTSANPRVTVTYTGGLGVAIGSGVGTIAQATDADGKITFQIWLGQNDTGTGTITATYNKVGNTDVAANKFTTTQTVTVGTVASAQSTSVKRTGNTVAVRVTGYAKSRIVLNGVRVASRSTLGTLSRNLTLRAGRNVIQIVVDGTVIRTVRYTR